MFRFNHFNFNVLDLNKSLDFYKKALALNSQRTVDTDDFTLVFLGDGKTEHLLELTWLKDRTAPYNLGENEFHLAFRVAEFDQAYELHKQMGCICYENKDMGIYFIADPDGYWVEIIPVRM